MPDYLIYSDHKYMADLLPKPEKIQPFEQPKFPDPSEIIMQAAALQQKDRELAHKKTQDVLSLFTTLAELNQRREDAKIQNIRAAAVLQGMNPMTMSEMNAVRSSVKLPELTEEQYKPFSSMPRSEYISKVLPLEVAAGRPSVGESQINNQITQMRVAKGAIDNFLNLQESFVGQRESGIVPPKVKAILENVVAQTELTPQFMPELRQKMAQIKTVADSKRFMGLWLQRLRDSGNIAVAEQVVAAKLTSADTLPVLREKRKLIDTLFSQSEKDLNDRLNEIRQRGVPGTRIQFGPVSFPTGPVKDDFNSIIAEENQ